ncbi:MAG TPA: archaetidylserine decarboxylase [Gammaproteobacteria bacterium]|nr:archaetidylserine decarboxylase [Gammaproteobacteria bacterium]
MQAERATDSSQTWLARAAKHERLNFLVTNRLPRRAATLLMGRLSRVENRFICGLSLGLWRLFAGDFRFDEAAETRFKSVHDCFTRALRPGARAIAPETNVVASPCDGIVGAHGNVEGTKLYQIKGFPYDLGDLLNDRALVEKYRDGVYVTLRLTSNMYHRFHAPLACRVREVIYVSGDTWNVNPIALRRVERLYCKNERAVIDLDVGTASQSLALVPVAAILVASIRLHCLPAPLTLEYRGPNRIACDRSFAKGEEMGWFEHGSTIIVFGTKGFEIDSRLTDGATIRMGEPLLLAPRSAERNVGKP